MNNRVPKRKIFISITPTSFAPSKGSSQGCAWYSLVPGDHVGIVFEFECQPEILHVNNRLSKRMPCRFQVGVYGDISGSRIGGFVHGIFEFATIVRQSALCRIIIEFQSISARVIRS